eukprot:476835-Amphidinium_carterae.1
MQVYKLHHARGQDKTIWPRCTTSFLKPGQSELKPGQSERRSNKFIPLPTTFHVPETCVIAKVKTPSTKRKRGPKPEVSTTSLLLS